jgi:hypothetical protein
VARHRRSNVYPFQPPWLLTFRAGDWLPATGLEAWLEWHDARDEYLTQHPDEELDGMDAVDVIFERPPIEMLTCPCAGTCYGRHLIKIISGFPRSFPARGVPRENASSISGGDSKSDWPVTELRHTKSSV